MEQKTVACLASYFKGADFMDEMKKLGYRVILITSENIKHKNWPWEAISEVFYMHEIRPSEWDMDHLIQGFSYLLKSNKIDLVIGLDDYDVEKVALIRETFRIPGMGLSTQRFFRDKLAMRQKAKESQISVPAFTSIFNDECVNDFADRVSPPWVLKPRSEASASGIRKIDSKDQLWESIHSLGEERYKFLLESFKPGDVFHVDALTYDGSVVFTSASGYLAPPMKVSHEGGVFRTRTLSEGSKEFKILDKLNKDILKAFGMKNGASHTEFIHCENDGGWYFLETSARVGGAHIPDLVEASTGVNLWREWAKIEDASHSGKNYVLNNYQNKPAGLLISLIKEEVPDWEVFKNEEVYKFLEIPYHAGIVYHSDDEKKVIERLDEAAECITNTILQILPPKEKPTA